MLPYLSSFCLQAYAKIQLDHVFEAWKRFPSSLILLAEGTITVTTPKEADGDRVLDFDDEEQGEGILKTLHPGSCLNSTSQLFLAFSRQTEQSLGLVEHEQLSKVYGSDIIFTSVTAAKLCVIPLLDSSQERVPNDVVVPIIHSLLKRLYFVTFRLADSSFGLHNEVVRCESKLHQITNASSASKHDGLALAPQVSRSHPADKNAQFQPHGVSQAVSPFVKELRNEGPQRALSVSLSPPPGLGQRKRSFLRLQTAISPAPRSCDSPNEFTLLSPSLLSQTELKEKRFALMSGAQGESAQRQRAALSIFRILGCEALQNDSLTLLSEASSSIKILSFDEGSYIAHQGERYAGFFFIISGAVEAITTSGESTNSGDRRPSPQVCIATFMRLIHLLTMTRIRNPRKRSL